MKKVRGQSGLTKFITSRMGVKNKKEFATLIKANLPELSKKFDACVVEMSVVSFSSSKDYYDQVLSIFSFLKNIGTPVTWTIYSDGSHTDEQIELLQSNFNFISVLKPEIDSFESTQGVCKASLIPYCGALLDFSKKSPYGKKLFYYLNHCIERPTLFIDADIVFYSKAALLKPLINDKINGWFLPDNGWGCLDSRHIQNQEPQMYQVNSGFFLLNKEISNLTQGLEFLQSLDGKYENFSEQSVFHILFMENHFFPLDPRIFVLNSGDQFDFSYLFNRDKIAVRHYTGPVRHKMWQRNWRWQLSLS